MKKTVIVVLTVVALAVAALLWMVRGERPVAEEKPAPAKVSLIPDAEAARKPARKIAHKAKAAKARARGKGAQRDRKRTFGRTPVVDNYSQEDRKLADAVQSALDDDNLENVRKAAAEAMKSENPEVRREAVDALGWFDDKALVELTRAMFDKSPEVAESARGHVETSLMGMEDNDRSFALAAEYIKLFPKDADAREMFSGVLTSAGNQLIDPDDADSVDDVAQARAHRSGIVDFVTELVGMGGTLGKTGREIYESISGEEWTTREAADKWANGVEEPEPEEEEQEAAES